MPAHSGISTSAAPPQPWRRPSFVQLRDWAKGGLQLTHLYHTVHRLNWLRMARSRPVIGPWNRQHGAIFVHIPKTAGMSIYKGFGMQVGPLGTHVPAYVYEDEDPTFFEIAYKFAVVRNPWDRVVSAFHFLKTSPWPQDQDWSARYLNQMGSFGEFVRALERPSYRLRVLPTIHFHPQCNFLFDLNGELAVNHIIDFANLADGLRSVAAELRLDYVDERDNASDHRNYREYYDARGRRLIGRMYAQDIEQFGFQF